MDKVNKQELRRLAEAATPGPWKECGHARGGCSCGLVWSRSADLPVAEAWRGDQEAPEPAEGAKSNAAFIAAANPAAILTLLDELEEKDRALDLWSQKAQRISDELEQYRKDVLRYRWLKEKWHGFRHYRDSTGTVANVDREIDEAIAVDGWKPMAKEGGANG